MRNQEVILRDNDRLFIEVVLQEIRKINPKALFEISYYPSNIRVQIQSDQEFRGRIFNKIHHLHKIYGLKFNLTQFLKRDKTLISFDLSLKTDNDIYIQKDSVL